VVVVVEQVTVTATVEDSRTTLSQLFQSMAEVNGLPASSSVNGINGHSGALANPAPAHAAFDSIADVVEAFGV
jgi:hypothetical protein